MTTAATPSQPLRGDICPPWRAGESGYIVDRNDTHADDRGVVHDGGMFAVWQEEVENARLKPGYIAVYVSGFRHDHSQDWPDQVCVEPVECIGEIHDLRIDASDARKLAEALVRGADMIEGHA